MNAARTERQTQTGESHFSATGYVLLPFFEACRGVEIRELEEILIDNREALSAISPELGKFGLNKVHIIDKREVVMAAYSIITNSQTKLPAETAFRIADGLADCAARVNEKDKFAMMEIIGEKGALETANRLPIIGAIIQGYGGIQNIPFAKNIVEKGLGTLTLVGKAPKKLDNLAKLLFMCKEVETVFTNFLLVDTLIREAGDIELHYSYVPGSEWLANRLNVMFNIGTIIGTSSLVGVNDARVSQIDGGEFVDDLFGEKIKLMTKPPAMQLLTDIPHEIRGGDLIIDSRHCATLDERMILDFRLNVKQEKGIIKTTKELVQEGNDTIFRRGERYHLYKPMKQFRLKVEYDYPKSSAKYYYLPLAGLGGGVVSGSIATLLTGDVKYGAATGILAAVSASCCMVFTSSHMRGVGNENLEATITQSLKQLEKAQLKEAGTKEEIILYYKLIQETMDALTKQQEALQKAQLLGNAALLTAAVAHDLSNVFTALGFYIEKGELKEAYDLFQRAVELNGGLRRIVAGEMDEKKIIYLPDFLGDETRILQNIRDFNNLSLVIDDPDRALFVRSSPISLKQIYQNLVINAFDASKSVKRIEIAVKGASMNAEVCRRINHQQGMLSASEGEYALTIVKDYGKGIAKNAQPNIFNFGWSSKGTDGIGLAAVVARLEQEGGFIRFKTWPEETYPKSGTEFYVYLPLAPNPENQK